jgi:hypothetical protein
MVKATAKVSTAATVTLKHLAAKLAEIVANPRQLAAMSFCIGSETGPKKSYAADAVHCGCTS